MKRTLNRETLIHSVRIAARVAESDKPPNPAFVHALQTIATALEEAKISSRSDGDYLMVKLPENGIRIE